MILFSGVIRIMIICRNQFALSNIDKITAWNVLALLWKNPFPSYLSVGGVV